MASVKKEIKKEPKKTVKKEITKKTKVSNKKVQNEEEIISSSINRNDALRLQSDDA